MTLHPPKEKWKTPVLREERKRGATREATNWTLGDLLGAAVAADRAQTKRRAELLAAGFKPFGDA